MERVLFIVPPHIQFNQFINPSFNERVVEKKNRKMGSVLTEMPLGILSISAYVKKHKSIECKLVDFNIELNKLNIFNYGSFLEFFHDYLKKEEWTAYNPEIIGISTLFTPAYQSMMDIAHCCRNLFHESFIIAGGSVPTNMYNEIYNEDSCFDALCYGEGEKPFLDLLQSENRWNLVERHSSWITKNKVKNGESYKHDFVDNLDDIPFFDYSICETDAYGLNPAITAYASIEEKKQNYHVMTSRGCPNHCCFCSSHTVHGKKIRYYSIQRVKEDFLQLQNVYGARTLIFQDDHFMGNRERALKIIKIIEELKIKAVFQNGLALYALNREMLNALKSAGINQLLLSVESGSEKVLKEIMHKPLNLSIIKRVINDCRDLNIYTNINILIGLPGETKEDIDNARSFLRDSGGNWFLIFCANPLIGSEMYEICKTKNYLKDNAIGSDYKKAVVETEDFTSDYIQEMAYHMNLELNFVENSDMKSGDYRTALKGFENAIKAKNDHVFGYYFAAKCCKKLGDQIKAEQYHAIAQENASKSLFWKSYLDKFNLSIEVL
jgi:anaerobic magnesium-protoporphyrin IX monomethyl ester cyclase